MLRGITWRRHNIVHVQSGGNIAHPTPPNVSDVITGRTTGGGGAWGLHPHRDKEKLIVNNIKIRL
jgi:hypothetical protein